ncbi:hypothetical protein KR215_005214 [Drosophila sulfurigaster]|nr:hypothetical protein KR215_005214 [Drosophila sulfurigaster]
MSFSLLQLSVLSVDRFSANVTRYTNVKCVETSPLYVTFRQCHLKVLGRGLISLTVQAVLLKDPITNGKVNLGLWRKYNGFRPFMFNTTFDFCKMVSTSKYKLSFEKVFHDAVAQNSNINHSCPYDKELYIRNWVLKEEQLKLLPLPSGEYQIKLMAFTDNECKAIVYINFSVKEDLMQS